MPTLTLAVVDTETTGLSASVDRIVEIAVKLLDLDQDGRLVAERAEYQSLHDPGIRIPRDAIAVHGITDAMVKGHRIDGVHVAQLLAAADLVVAHNSGFDKGFVRQVVPQSDALPWRCSCRGIPWKRIYPHLGSTSLPYLARALRLKTGTAHRALGDVETTVALLLQADPAGRPHVCHVLPKTAKQAPKVTVPGADPATRYVLDVLRQFPDRECSTADLFAWQGARPRHGQDALERAARALLDQGLLAVAIEGGVRYWAIAERK